MPTNLKAKLVLLTTLALLPFIALACSSQAVLVSNTNEVGEFSFTDVSYDRDGDILTLNLLVTNISSQGAMLPNLRQTGCGSSFLRDAICFQLRHPNGLHYEHYNAAYDESQAIDALLFGFPPRANANAKFEYAVPDHIENFDFHIFRGRGRESVQYRIETLAVDEQSTPPPFYVWIILGVLVVILMVGSFGAVNIIYGLNRKVWVVKSHKKKKLPKSKRRKKGAG